MGGDTVMRTQDIMREGDEYISSICSTKKIMVLDHQWILKFPSVTAHPLKTVVVF